MNGVKKKATIKDVALRAEVSPTTVSMVLNGKSAALPESTCERVRAAAAELNYSADVLARALVTKKTNIVGVVVPDISNAFFSEAVRHIQVEIARYGYDIILCNSEERAESDERYISLLAGRNVDGLILTPSAESFTAENAEKIKRLLAGLHVPYLFFDRYYTDGGTRVAVDNEASSYAATQYLLENGHKKIGVIAGPLTLNSSRNRLKGVRRALSERGLSLSDEFVYEGRYDFATGVNGGEMLLKKDVTAIFAFSDMQAYGVYESAKRAGKRIPDDVSVMGFDDNIYSSVLEVPLSTMRQPVETIAKEVCRSILALIENKEAEAPACCPARLVRRSSVADISKN
ncbi:MAG: LacI family DNA-binding transcriptional regulator [Clostridia bacterium]|nr:LacI family DNA-binding transcriptional regulator [Clostridia bacterium]